MQVEWSSPDLAYLRGQFMCGNVTLFAGAGFSVDATNASGSAPPLGKDLARLLARKAGNPYNDEPLAVVYESVEPVIGTKALRAYLRSLFSVTGFQEWYRVVPALTWRRIYTTNIDDLLQILYVRELQQRLCTIVCPANPEDRDQLFKSLQCVHLHGHISKDSPLTFTPHDFALNTARPNPWYQMFVDDLYSSPILFVGSDIDQTPYHHYLALRDTRLRESQEFRPKSFLVGPGIGPIRDRVFRTRNIVPIECTAREFFESLRDSVDLREFSCAAVRQRVFPHIEIRSDHVLVDSEVSRHFDPIVPGFLPPMEPGTSYFFLGAEPTWDDIKNERDAPREIGGSIVAELVAPASTARCYVIHGPAGCGKTTLLMRIAQQLAQQGNTVYFAKGQERLEFGSLLTTAKEMAAKKQRCFVFVDLLTRHLGSLAPLPGKLIATPNLTLVLADRTNTYFNRNYAVSGLKPVEIAMPDLSKPDVERIIAKLEKFGFLGALRAKSPQDRINEFMVRASKQLLVAMKEATSGKGFDIILNDEFQGLGEEARLAYLICCLAVARGAPGVYRRHLMPCLGSPSFRKAEVLDKLLRGVLLPANATGTMLRPRHRFIANWVTTEIAPLDLAYEATAVFLRHISADIVPNEITRRSPAYLAYRGMINCDGLWELFRGDAATVCALYDDLKPFYDSDFLFWLQHGMAFIKAGQLDVAENYLQQSLSLRPKSHQTLHQLGILYLLQATNAPNPAAYIDKANEGIKILKSQIAERGDHDSYPYAAYLTYVARWFAYAGRGLVGQKDWESLRRIEEEALERWSRDDIVVAAVKEAGHLYLMRAIHGKDSA